MNREVREEWLDTMDPAAPAAQRSRRDLRRINSVMGNERWIRSVLHRHRDAVGGGIVEWGGGDGRLAALLAQEHPALRLRVIDRVARPAHLAGLGERLSWESVDVLDSAPPAGGAVVANLFLHHFEADALRRLGGLLASARLLVASEPDRSMRAYALGWMAQWCCGKVTRHDMLVSIRAGFAVRELPDLLGLDARVWRVREHATWGGARRVVALRH